MSKPKDYTVGWICAVLKEYTAAQLFLDTEHEPPTGISANDTNHYTLGEIAGHNVVIAVLPDGEYGVGSAASVVTNMLNSFPNTRIGLMVGIGGGAPTSKNDIRLGDVVVSSPLNGTGGVYQYDLGKTIQDVGFVQTGILDQPSATVRSALPGLRRRYDLKGHQIKETVDSILERWPRLRKKGFARPSPESDRLFASNIVHPHASEGDCSDLCLAQQSSIVFRPPREDDDDDPTIHYGLIASGNQLMKDAVVRDKLAKEKNILCFEMEAAGIMNRFPCMVIRGICDYSDSHKNKDWQGYAALTAAAYAKDLLKEIQPSRVETEERLAICIDECKQWQVSEKIHGVDTSLEDIKTHERSKAIIEWLRAPDPSVNHNRAHEKHGAGTGQWLYSDTQFLRWRSTPNDFIWLFGPSGCGKTVLSSTVIEYLIKHDSRPVIFFYFDFNDQNKQNFENMIRSFLTQLYNKSPVAHSLIQSLHTSHAGGSQQPSTMRLENTLTAILEQVGGCKVVIDALDESKTCDRVIRWCKDINALQTVDMRLLVTSQTYVVDWHDAEQTMHITTSNVSRDISIHIHARLDEDEFNNLHGQPALRERVREILVKKAGGMFRWADLQLESLSKCHNKLAIEKALDDLPDTLNGTYSRIMDTVKSSRHCREAVSILQMLLWSSDSMLTIDGFNDAIVVQPDLTPAFDKANRLFDLSSIISICSGLVLLMRIDDTALLSLCFAHSSVKDFLLSPEVPPPFKSQLEERVARLAILRTCFAYLQCLDWDFDDVVEFTREHQFAVCANNIWPRQARALEATDDEALALIIGFLESDLQRSTPFFRFTYPRIAPSGQEWCALYVAATEGLVRSCRHLIERELASARSLTQPDDLMGGSTLEAKDAGTSNGSDIRNIIGRISAAAPSHSLQFRLDNALVTASLNGHDDIVRDLLHHGASASAIDQCNFLTPPGGSALLAAAEYGHLEVVKMLVKAGASINHLVPGVFGTPLYAASKLGHVSVVEFLTEQKADPNVICGTCGNALLAAVQGNHADIVNTLIACGADVDVVPWNPDLPASLIEDGHDPAAWNNPTLLFAARYGIGLNVIQAASLSAEMIAGGVLVDMGADLESVVKAAMMRTAVSCGHGFSPLQSASSSGRLGIVEALVKAGAEINALGYHGTAFALAAQNGHEDIVDFLLERADVNLKRSVFLDGLDWTPLEEAAAKRQATIVRKILTRGAVIPDNVLALAAAVSGNADVVKLLIAAKANTEGRDIFGRTALQNAAVIGHEATVEMLLRYGTCVDAPGPDDTKAMHFSKAGAIKHAILVRGVEIDPQADGLEYGTALQAAVYRGHHEIVRILLAYGASIEATGPKGDALTIAASSGKMDMLNLLLESNESISRISSGSTSLRVAANKGHVNVVARLLSYGVPPDVAGPAGTALHDAVANGHEDVVRTLLAGGANVNSDAGNGFTPLRFAVEGKHTSTVRLLLAHNADVNTVSNHGSTLGYAVETGELEIVNLLLSQGALVEVNRGPTFLTPLQVAVFKGYEQIVNALLDAGADPNALDEAKLGSPPLKYACQINREDIARLLLERGADVNGTSKESPLTPIQFCCSMGYESLVNTLVSFNAAIDAPYPDVCALDRAANKGYLSIVTYLLDHGADPNFDNEVGTLLQDAAYTGDVALVTVLLDHGADIDHSCRETCPGRGICALLQAVAMDHEDIVELLMSRGASLEVAIGDAVRMGDEVIMEKMLALRPVFLRYERSRQ